MRARKQQDRFLQQVWKQNRKEATTLPPYAIYYWQLTVSFPLFCLFRTDRSQSIWPPLKNKHVDSAKQKQHYKEIKLLRSCRSYKCGHCVTQMQAAERNSPARKSFCDTLVLVLSVGSVHLLYVQLEPVLLLVSAWQAPHKNIRPIEPVCVAPDAIF